MPLYEYGCDACGHKLEIQQKLAEAPLRTCPVCGKETLERLISATSFVLKGGGWYKDGYSGPAPHKADKAGSDDKGDKKSSDGDKGGGKEGTKSDGGGSSSASAPAASDKSSSSASSSSTGDTSGSSKTATGS